MKSQTVDEIMACLPYGKTHFRYYPGAYAPRLLSLLIPEQMRLKKLKQTRFKRLLEHKNLRDVVASSGGGILHREALDAVWQEPSQPFLLSLCRWGSNTERDYHQTSRFGENLVLQLNLPKVSQRKFKEWINPDSTLTGSWSYHPVQLPYKNPLFRDTLAWSRIDLDFRHNEALIEEVQSDSVRDVRRWARRYRRCGCKRCRQRLLFVDWFDNYANIWSEALLMATIWFINQELGIERIYMHTARSGWQVKKMCKSVHAPRSLYSDLPRKFAFKRTWAAPEFLLETRCYKQLIRKQPDIDFYQLSMDELKNQFASELRRAAA
ncbi:MAG: hypothetical protein AAF431_11465 [Pseudomonadota bacterium]